MRRSPLREQGRRLLPEALWPRCRGAREWFRRSGSRSPLRGPVHRLPDSQSSVSPRLLRALLHQADGPGQILGPRPAGTISRIKKLITGSSAS